MKRQKLFNSFWLAITTAVLATQSAWADTVQVVSDNRNLQVAPSAAPTPTSPLRPSPANNICMAETPAPSYLDPNPNPLQFPTKPEEVQIQGTQPINLQQALNLAQRNNRQLQVGALTLERSQAALREAQAGLYPTLNISSSLTRSQSASGQTQAAQPSQPGAQPNLDAPSTEQGEQGEQGEQRGRGESIFRLSMCNFPRSDSAMSPP